ncbi:MAG: DNA polymerase Y family protein, partial [Planctomycetes bacterium]|nr:DNA polymerase Y family protein [Planctomycetota bacterium]
MACANVAALPLQLLLRRHADWRDLPAAVVSEDKPQGTVLWTNERARRAGVLPGHSYAAALSLERELRAGVVAGEEVDRAAALLLDRLWRFTPEVEAALGCGVFWLGAAGLGGLYPSLERWAREICADLRAQGFECVVVAGFSRFGTYALAKSARANRVLRSPGEERAAAAGVPLALLDIAPDLRDVLAKLGIATIEGFLRLPAGGLLARFGHEAHRLHQLAAGEAWDPLAPRPLLDPLERSVLLDEPVAETTRLLFVVKQLLHPLLEALVVRGAALAALLFSLRLERAVGFGAPQRLEPAVPTLDTLLILDLVRLRLETLALGAGVIEVHVEAEAAPATREQLQIFAEEPRRDLAAANRALARLRAELGEDAVLHAVLRPGHLPESKFAWQPLAEIRAPRVPQLPAIASAIAGAASLA